MQEKNLEELEYQKRKVYQPETDFKQIYERNSNKFKAMILRCDIIEKRYNSHINGLLIYQI